MKFLSSSERADVFAKLLGAVSEQSAATLAAPENELVPSYPSPKHSKMDEIWSVAMQVIALEVGLRLKVV